MGDALLFALIFVPSMMAYMMLGFYVAHLLKWDSFTIDSLGCLFILWPVGLVIELLGRFIKLIQRMNDINGDKND